MDRTKYARGRIDRLFESGRPVTVVFQEVADTFACLDCNEFEALCLTLLWERYHQSCYEEHPKPETPLIPKDRVAALPDGDTKRAAEGEWEHYDIATGWRRESIEQLRLTEAALRDRDGAVAFLVLDALKAGEYESFDVEVSQVFKEPPQVDLIGTAPDWMEPSEEAG